MAQAAYNEENLFQVREAIVGLHSPSGSTAKEIAGFLGVPWNKADILRATLKLGARESVFDFFRGRYKVNTQKITIHVMEDGQLTHFRISRSTQMQKVMSVYASRIHFPLSRLRFTLNGAVVSASATMDDLDLKSGDQIQVTRSYGGRGRYGKGLGKGSVGVFGEHLGSVGIEILDGRSAHPIPADAQRILSELRSGAEASYHSEPEKAKYLTSAQCKQLMDTADQCWDGTSRDFKLLLTDSELTRIIGDASFGKLTQIFGDHHNKIIVRRCTEYGRSIKFHTDHSLKTLQVPLNGDDEYEGGRLVYVTKSGFETPRRPAGSVTIHRNDIVHGVTRHVSGTRYGLFLLQEPVVQSARQAG